MKKPIAIAKDWNEMPLRLWQEEQEILKDQETDAVDKNVRLVALMYDMSEDEAYNTELNEFSNIHILSPIVFPGFGKNIRRLAKRRQNGYTNVMNLKEEDGFLCLIPPIPLAERPGRWPSSIR